MQEPLAQLPWSQTTRVHVRIEGNTVWLSQRDMADLFQTTPQNVTIHIGTIYEEGELVEAATCKDFLQVAAKGNVKSNVQSSTTTST